MQSGGAKVHGGQQRTTMLLVGVRGGGGERELGELESKRVEEGREDKDNGLSEKPRSVGGDRIRAAIMV